MIDVSATARIDAHEILGVLGRGGTGEILLARTRGPYGFSRLVAIKRLSQPALHDDAAKRSLAREALAYARLAHPSILRLYELLEHDGAPALVLEYVDGLSLKRLRRALAVRGARLTDRSVLYVMSRVFSALAAAHAARDPETFELASVIHRDVSPGNVLVSHDGDVKLADFGIARLAGVLSDTLAGTFKGTYGYMAPEQVTGGQLTPRTDVYSACLLLRELLVGKPAFEERMSGEGALLRAMANPKLSPMAAHRPDVPRDIANAIATGLEPNAERRAISAAEMHAILTRHVPDLRAARDELARIAALVHRRRTATAPEDLEATRPFVVSTPPAPIAPTPPPARAASPSLAPSSSAAFPAAPPRSRRVAVVAFATLATFGAVATVVAQIELARRASLPAASFDAKPIVAVPPATIAEPPREPSKSPAPAPSPLAREGALVISPTRIPHRVFVDGRVVGETSAGETRLRVACGGHTVQVGSRGRAAFVDVRCGEHVAIAAR